jgi:hypothetical protein
MVNTEQPSPKNLPAVLAGSVHAEYSRCGKPSCRCATGERHGPFYRRHWREAGRKRSRYIPLADVPDVVAACQRHAQLHMSRRALRRMIRDVERCSDELIALLEARSAWEV